MAERSPLPDLLRHETDGAALAAALREAFAAWRGEAAGVRIVRAPGRVNLIGEHTDYNDGFVLPMTLGRAVYVVLRARADDRILLRSLNFGEDVALRVGEPPAAAPSHWSAYAGGVLHALHARGEIASGLEALIFGNVPLGAGLSSSAALEVAVAVGVEAVTGARRDAVETALLCREVEQEYAGVQCGIMDQFAARLGRAGHALWLDCRTLDYRHVPLPFREVGVVVIDSGVERQLAGSRYNERRAECEQAVRYLQTFDPSVRALRDVTPTLLAWHGAGLPAPVRDRAQHVVEENERVEEAVRLLEQGDLAGFGACMNRSHASLRDRYQVSCAELDFLVATAQQTPGVLGARMTGAGFGGCTVNLVERAATDVCRREVPARYRARFGRAAAVYPVEDNVEAGVMVFPGM